MTRLPLVWRVGLRHGLAAAVATLVLNFISRAVAASNGCASGMTALTYLAFLIFLGLSGASGFSSRRAGATLGRASIAGMIVGAISGVAQLIVIIPNAVQASACVSHHGIPVADRALVATLAGVFAGALYYLAGLLVGAAAGAVGGILGERRSRSAAP